MGINLISLKENGYTQPVWIVTGLSQFPEIRALSKGPVPGGYGQEARPEGLGERVFVKHLLKEDDPLPELRLMLTK